MKIVAVILTFNEERHLPRCLASLKGIVNEALVVDCHSTDGTERVAAEYGAKFVKNDWVNHAVQFNWGLDQLDDDVDWVFRIDADEYVTPALAGEIETKLATLGEEIEGVYCNRRMMFQGRLIRYGGVYPIRVLRLFRRGRGRCENRWMDEHIQVSGDTADFAGDLIDENLNTLTWWTAKHNGYASREAVDMLNLKYGFLSSESAARLSKISQPGYKRWLKESVYARLPGGYRAFAYFFYRYFVRLGFLDGRPGAMFHVLQGFWYRYLVDAKIDEVERYKAENRCDIIEAIERVLAVELGLSNVKSESAR
ncbi:MAG: glycosyltransferase family 2 protein [Gammaproteobacteria bacterium]